MTYKKKDKDKKVLAHNKNDANTTDEVLCSVSSFEASVDTSFFYTSDRILNSFDDLEIILKIQEKYPDFNLSNKDTQLKKILLLILDDKIFIDDLMEYYQIDILELFKILYKQYSSLFNKLFIKKIKDKLQTKKYAKIDKM